MPTPAEALDMAAALQNDAKRKKYTYAAMLPYFNIALRNLQEEFELNEIPVTEAKSDIITVPAGLAPGITQIGFGTVPALPANLIEIQQLWESTTGQNTFIPVSKRDFLPSYLEGVMQPYFGIWAWNDNAIQLFTANQANDLKLDYIKSLFATITDSNFDSDLGVKFKNCLNYLGFRTAALCSFFIGENETRATALQLQATDAIETSMGISVKGQQSIPFRRRPFRSSYKARNMRI